ncbi:hypothetical protein CEXT_494821 [Caerostris extrusa]|uniref:Uncharacterized protein n=1 Tax=Caerostris extrusa TaxID=172846 RepID=A0AAV4NZW1_CAEEX|nr:hypothetical protein CEXT_494821 [Caerostris extrusa]
MGNPAIRRTPSFRSHQLSAEVGERRSRCHFPTSNPVVAINAQPGALHVVLHESVKYWTTVSNIEKKPKSLAILFTFTASDIQKRKPSFTQTYNSWKTCDPSSISFRSHQLSVANVDHVATFQLPILSLPINALPPRLKHSPGLCTQPCTECVILTAGIKSACLIMDQWCVGMACMIYKRPTLCVTSQWLGILGNSVAVRVAGCVFGGIK